MNYRTTIVLMLLLAAGSAFWGYSAWKSLPPTVDPVVALLHEELAESRLRKISVATGSETMAFERADEKSEWSMPGNWPTRKAHVAELVKLIANLRTRFEPTTPQSKDLASFGLEKPPVVVTVSMEKGKDVTLKFGEERSTESNNRFARPTYLMVNDMNKVVRLGPGILPTLSRPAEYYLMRRLFPVEKIREGESTSEQLTASRVTIESAGPPADPPDAKPTPATKFTLEKQGDEWLVVQPIKDAADPAKVKSLLTGIPDFWAEQFIAKPDAKLDTYGLAPAEQRLQVTTPQGTLTLLVGKPSPRTVVIQNAAEEPEMPFGKPPAKPTQTIVRFRYAKLENSDRIFEIKEDKIKDVFVSVDRIRDENLARFKTEDVQEVEISAGGQTLHLKKSDSSWKFAKPIEVAAETSKVDDLLRKLSGLRAGESDIVADGDPKKLGLESPAGTARLTLEEEVPAKKASAKPTKRARTIEISLGKEIAETKKVHVQVKGRGPIFTVARDELAQVLEPSVVALQTRKIVDLASADLETIDIEQPKEKLQLKQADGTWKLAVPVVVDIAQEDARSLASALSDIEATEVITNEAKPDDLEKTYGLAKPRLTALLTPTKSSNKKSVTLLVGKSRDAGTYFAKTKESGAVFLVKKELVDKLERESLGYRSTKLWENEPPTSIQLDKAGKSLKLTKEQKGWKLIQPVEADINPATLVGLTKNFTGMSAKSYVAHNAADLAQYGLDKPYLRVALTHTAMVKDKEEMRSRVVLIGKPTEPTATSRFAKLGDNEGIFVLEESAVAPLEVEMLDLLDRQPVVIDSDKIVRIEVSGSASLKLQKMKDAWQVFDSPVGSPFTSSKDPVEVVLFHLGSLSYQKLLAYQPTAEELTKFGLDKPTLTIRLTEEAKEGEKPREHVLLLGQPAEKGRIAQVQGTKSVGVLAPETVRVLQRSYLDYFDPLLSQSKEEEVASIERQSGNETFQVIQKEKAWSVAKPSELKTEAEQVERFVKVATRLEGVRVVAYQPKELKPFGLDQPTAIITIAPAKAGEKPIVVHIGSKASEGTPTNERHAMLVGGKTVVVLNEETSKLLLAPPVAFRDRAVSNLSNVDRVIVEQGTRKLAFAKKDGRWSLVDPVESSADKIEPIVRELSKLHADEWLAEQPADLKAYGLAEPRQRWKLEAEGKVVFNLLVGTETNGRSHAKVADQPRVFLLAADLSKQLGQEQRTGRLWKDSFDPAQARRLKVSRSGAVLYELEKIGGTWTVVGQPDNKVVETKVNDLLAALADLNAERYVLDKDADLKLYGLEPVQWLIEAESPSGKRILRLGRTEGDSKRIYGYTTDQSGVFVISEQSAHALARELKDLR